jgi:hypothetical protein
VHDTVALPFPHQFYAITAPFRAMDGRKNKTYPFLTGEGFTRCRFVTVEELMKKLLARRIGSRIDEYEC